MDIAVLDFETYYSSKDFSLSKMTTEEYINDQRFQVIGVAVKFNDDPSVWYPGGDIPNDVFNRMKESMVVCHNTLFDGAILSWKYGFKPAMWGDTLSMARPFHNANVGGSLKRLVEIYGIGEKGTEVIQADGKRLEDFSAAELKQYGEYCKNDVELTHKLFCILADKLPLKEIRLIDLTLRMYIEPRLLIDPSMVQKEIELDQTKKDALFEKLSTLSLGEKSLSSNNQFAELLQTLGVEPPTKVSIKTGKKTWAFAKGDSDFLALLESEDPLVVAAVEARMGSKSTQKQSRAQRFLGIHKRMGGRLPVPLGYYNAHTGRYGGMEKINLQNLPRASKKDADSGLLRKAIMAPAGQSLVVMDFSQIEARVLAWLAGQQDKVEAFANKRDVYSEQASVIYGRKVDRKNNPDDFTPGFIGKAVVLGCGYGLGYLKFAGMIFTGMLGEKGILFDDGYVDVLGVDPSMFRLKLESKGWIDKVLDNQPVALTEDQWIKHCTVADKIIRVFRESNSKIVDLWSQADNALGAMLDYDPEGFTEFGGPTRKLIRIRPSALLLPNGMELRYEGLQRDRDGFSYLRRKEGKVQRVKTYGGSVVENLTQALARIPTTDVMLKADRIGMGVVLQAHDEIGLVVPTDDAQLAYEWMLKTMRAPPKWAAGLPLDAEGGIGKRYGEVK